MDKGTAPDHSTRLDLARLLAGVSYAFAAIACAAATWKTLSNSDAIAPVVAVDLLTILAFVLSAFVARSLLGAVSAILIVPFALFDAFIRLLTASLGTDSSHPISALTFYGSDSSSFYPLLGFLLIVGMGFALRRRARLAWIGSFVVAAVAGILCILQRDPSMLAGVWYLIVAVDLIRPRPRGRIVPHESARLGLALVMVFVCATMNPTRSSPAVADRALIGTWLPQAVLLTAFEKRWSALTLRPDSFVCGKPPASDCPTLRNGTQFKDGRTGTIDEVVYDPRHRLAFYREHCCAMDAAILIAEVRPPPVAIRAADLRGVRTMRGIRLGMSQAQVTRRYGRTSVHSLRGMRAGELLAYATETPAMWNSAKGAPCAQFQNLEFRGGRLVAVELIHGC